MDRDEALKLLKGGEEGVKKWNRRRKKKDEIPDLRGANLRGADLREADLREADLREADLRGADLREADLTEADLHGLELGKATRDDKEELRRLRREVRGLREEQPLVTPKSDTGTDALLQRIADLETRLLASQSTKSALDRLLDRTNTVIVMGTVGVGLAAALTGVSPFFRSEVAWLGKSVITLLAVTGGALLISGIAEKHFLSTTPDRAEELLTGRGRSAFLLDKGWRWQWRESRHERWFRIHLIAEFGSHVGIFVLFGFLILLFIQK